MLTPEQEQRALFGAINQLNKDAHFLNKNISPDEGVQNVPLAKDIYQPQPPPIQNIPQQPIPQQPIPQIQPQILPQQDLSPLIDRITSLEKQVTKFVNLIERNVAKNAKEINIRIKLNENNDSPDSK